MAKAFFYTEVDPAFSPGIEEGEPATLLKMVVISDKDALSESVEFHPVLTLQNAIDLARVKGASYDLDAIKKEFGWTAQAKDYEILLGLGLSEDIARHLSKLATKNESKA